jgi:3-oxoacyl-[acyl-carrier-protein] synthase II
MTRRVVITGIGALTPLGLSLEETWRALVEGRSGIAPVTHFDPKGHPCGFGGEVDGFDPSARLGKLEARRMARFSQLAVVAALDALDASGLERDRLDPNRAGVLLGNASGGLPEMQAGIETVEQRGIDRLSPLFFPMVLSNMAAANVSRAVGFSGYNSTVTTACASSTQAIGAAVGVIQRDAADVMLTGGTEGGVSYIGMAGFASMRALSRHQGRPEEASRPFDLHRDGFVAAEGAAVMVLESLEGAQARGAPMLAEILGFGSSSDAFHLVQPPPNGDGAVSAMRNALASASIEPDDIDYINAHGTATPLNDRIETLAIKRLFGDRARSIPISSTKSMIGHCLGAAGAIEAVACVQSLRTGIVHPTINLNTPDPDCDLDYVPNEAREFGVRTVLSNSFGFGGQNACLVLGRCD